MTTAKKTLNKTANKTANKTPAALFQLIVATFKYASYGDLELTIDCPYATVCYEPEHAKRYVAFLDFSVWPPSPLPLPTSLDDKLFAQIWSPFYCFGDTNIWKKSTVVNAKDIYEDFFTFAQVTAFNLWAVQTLGKPTMLLSQFFKISLLVNSAAGKWRYSACE